MLQFTTTKEKVNNFEVVITVLLFHRLTNET